MVKFRKKTTLTDIKDDLVDYGGTYLRHGRYILVCYFIFVETEKSGYIAGVYKINYSEDVDIDTAPLTLVYNSKCTFEDTGKAMEWCIDVVTLAETKGDVPFVKAAKVVHTCSEFVEEENVYTDMVKAAMSLSFKVHKKQKDRGGMPYIYHPMHLAEQFKDEKLKTLALLHDVVEDSDYSFEDVEKYSDTFTEDVIDALRCITKEDKEPYMNYISRVCANEMSRLVKIADLKHNLNTSRLQDNSILTDKQLNRIQKYREALDYLEEYKPE